MKHSTPPTHPKAKTIEFLQRLARTYRPELGITTEMAMCLALQGTHAKASC